MINIVAKPQGVEESLKVKIAVLLSLSTDDIAHVNDSSITERERERIVNAICSAVADAVSEREGD